MRARPAVLLGAVWLAGAAPPAAAQAPPELSGPAEVAVGGRLRLAVSPPAPGGELQQRRGGSWSRLRALPAGGALSVRAGRARTRVLRVRSASGATSASLGVRVRPLVLAAAGDVNLGDVPGRLIAERGAGAPWTSVGGVLRAADLAFANLECAISRRGRPEAKRFTFRGTPEALAGARRAAGLDVVNLANNHAVDFGRTALLDTIRTARAEGIVPVGAGTDARDAYAPRVLERLGLRVAFVGFSDIGPFGFRAGPGRAGTAWAFPGRVRAAVRRAAALGDVVVATFHWGTERDPSPTARQRALARTALDAGATAVVGAHPHVLQPVRRAGGGRLVAYSLGNFVFGANAPGTERTGVLALGLGAGRVLRHRVLPARIRGGRPVLRDAAGALETVGEVPLSR